jgi:hypothetical protein
MKATKASRSDGTELAQLLVRLLDQSEAQAAVLERQETGYKRSSGNFMQSWINRRKSQQRLTALSLQVQEVHRLKLEELIIERTVKSKSPLIFPKILSTVLISDQSLRIFFHYHPVILMRRSYRFSLPITTERVPSLSLTFDHDI